MQTVSWKTHILSKLCLGTVQFGINYGIANSSGQVTQSNANNILKYVLSEGINCLDTAKAYGNSESVIGNFIRATGTQGISVISKVKSELFDLSESQAIDDIKSSLKNLSLDSLFAILLHDSKILSSWTDSESALIKLLKEQNLMKYFGVSIYTDEEFELALFNPDIEIIQIPFNLFDQRAVSNHWLKQAKEKNKLIFIRSIYLQGLLLMDHDEIPDHLKSTQKYIKIIDSICNQLNITKNELALSYVNNIAKDSIILFGCDNLNQAQENIKNFNNLIELDQEVINHIHQSLSKISENIYNPSKWVKV